MKQQNRTELTDGDVTVGALKYLIHAFRSKRGSEDPRHGFTGGNVGLLSIEATQSGFLLLLPYYNERASEFIEGQRHCCTNSDLTQIQ